MGNVVFIAGPLDRGVLASGCRTEIRTSFDEVAA